MKVIITGATGFLGRNLAEGLHDDGLQVIATGRSVRVGAALRERGIAFHPAEILDAARLTDALSPADCVVHCAGRSGDWGSQEDFHRANVVGTRNVVRACQHHGIGRIVFISTPSLYYTGADRHGVTEAEPLPAWQTTHYARTKLIAEQELLAPGRHGREGPRVIILRPRACYGPHDDTIAPRILRMAERPRFPLVNGGRALVDITYVDNFVDAVRRSLEAPDDAWGEIYNVSNGDPISVREWFSRVLAIFERPFSPLEVPETLAMGVAALMELASGLPFGPREPSLTRFSVGYMARSLTMSIDKARERLGYAPRVGNEEGFRRYARWALEAGEAGATR